MAAVRTKKRTAAAADRLLNRELSFLDYAARVLALAEDPEVPLLERVKFCSICSTMLDEFFMVRVAGLTGQAAAGITVRSPDGRTAKQALADARKQVLELYAAQSQVWARQLCPALAEQGDRRLARRGPRARGARRARQPLRARDLPGAHAARGRPRPALPLHLGALDQPRALRARSGDGRGAVRAREGARGPAAAACRSARPGGWCRSSRC